MSSWTPLLAAHTGAALICLPIGGYQLFRSVKGDRVHRVLGRVWAVGMAFVAISSFWIRDLRPGQLSLLHVLSVVTLVSLVAGLTAIRRHNLTAHRASMRGSWFGLLAAFVGAVAVPRRLLPTFAVDRPMGALTVALLVVLITALLIVAAHRFDRAVRLTARAVTAKS